jgi:hypothetical protein
MRKVLRKDENPMKRLTREVGMRTNEKDDKEIKRKPCNEKMSQEVRMRPIRKVAQRVRTIMLMKS